MKESLFTLATLCTIVTMASSFIVILAGEGDGWVNTFLIKAGAAIIFFGCGYALDGLEKIYRRNFK